MTGLKNWEQGIVFCCTWMSSKDSVQNYIKWQQYQKNYFWDDVILVLDYYKLVVMDEPVVE